MFFVIVLFYFWPIPRFFPFFILSFGNNFFLQIFSRFLTKMTTIPPGSKSKIHKSVYPFVEFENLVFVSFLKKEAIVKILKTRKHVTLGQLQTELIELLKNMFLPSKKLVKETIEWLIENKYMKRDEENINSFAYTA